MAEKHEMGIECVQHFRNLINEILPFEGDLLASITNQEAVNRYNLALFFPDIAKGEQVQYLKTELINQD